MRTIGLPPWSLDVAASFGRVIPEEEALSRQRRMPGPQGGRGSRRGWRGESASIRARQVGISALIGHDLPGWDVVVFDPSIDVGNAGQDPDLFLDNLPAPLVLDEILYALEMTAAIKRRVDRGRQPGQYVLTGSQQWSAMRSIAESLAGRAVFLDLEGFSLSEIAEAGREDHWLCPLALSTGSVHWLGGYLDDRAAFVAAPPGLLPVSRSSYEHLWRGFLPEADSL